MATLSAIYGASPLNDSDGTQHNFTINISENTNVAALDNTPSDFSTMDDASFVLHIEYQLSAAGGDDTFELLAGIRKTGSGAHLAGATSSTNKSIVADVNNSTWTTANIALDGANGFVDTAASKTDWDAADVWVEQAFSKSKGNDNDAIQIRRVWITGTYTPFVATTYERTGSLSGTSTLTADAEKSSIHERTGSLSGTSTLTADGEIPDTVVLPFSDPETFELVTLFERTGSLSGTSTLTADGEKFSIHERTGTISGTSTFTADGEISDTAILPFSDPETFELTTAVLERTGTISGTSTFTADAEKFSILERTGTISGTSTLTADGAVVVTAILPFSDPETFELTVILVKQLKQYNGSAWVPIVVKHGVGWPVVQQTNFE